MFCSQGARFHRDSHPEAHRRRVRGRRLCVQAGLHGPVRLFGAVPAAVQADGGGVRLGTSV